MNSGSPERDRWLARIVIQRWRHRIWSKRVQCNVDMIDMLPVPDDASILLTDTTRRMIYRFHCRDVYSNLISNIGMSDEMLPSPRFPTNPWTNEPLTLAQTIGVCEKLARYYGKKGKCPPVLFAAFCAARFNLKQFYQQNSSLLAQHAITSYFKDLHQHNQLDVSDTIMILLTRAGLEFSALSIRKWLRLPTQTPLHREWLNMVRDYMLYINLRVQVRPSWNTQEIIYRDVRELYERTTLPSSTSQRMRYMSMPTNPDIVPPQPELFGMLGLPMMLHEGFNETMTEELLTQLLQETFGL